MVKVSIVMPVYNHERFLAQALDGILMQEVNFDYELILGEDCSTDSSREIVRQYEKRFDGKMIPLYRQKNLGAQKNIEDCFNRCKGEYTAYIEGDDYWTDPLKLQKQVDFLDKNKEYICVYHQCNIVDIDGKYIKKFNEWNLFHEFTTEDLEKFKLPGQSATSLRRNCEMNINNIKKYNNIVGDRLVIPLLLSKGKIAVMQESMSAYRYYMEENGSNWSSKHEGGFLYCPHYYYNMKLQLQRLCEELGLTVDLRKQRMLELKRAEIMRKYEGYNKTIVHLQELEIILKEPHGIKFYKEYIDCKDSLEF